MSKISYKFKKGKILLSNKLVYPENLNDQIYLRLSNGMLPGFLTVSAVTNGKTTVLKGSLEGFINLKEYLSDTISKNTFLNIITVLIKTVKYCDDNMMSPNNLDLDLERIFIKPQTSEIVTVYWPIVNNQLAAPVNKFFKEVINYLKLPSDEDYGFINSYSAFFSGITPFSLKNYEKKIDELKNNHSEERSDVSQNSNASVISEKNTHRRSRIEYDPFENIKNGKKDQKDAISVFASAAMPVSSPDNTVMCLSCGFINNNNSKYCRSCGAELVAPKPAVKTVSYPVIKRLSTGEVCVIDSSYYTIGTDTSCSFTVQGNYHISHKHAAIVYENEHFYLIDLGSTNGTYIENSLIPADHKAGIGIGTVFMIADELFELAVTDVEV